MKYCSTIPSATSARTLCGGVLRLVEFALLDLPRRCFPASLSLSLSLSFPLRPNECVSESGELASILFMASRPSLEQLFKDCAHLRACRAAPSLSLSA